MQFQSYAYGKNHWHLEPDLPAILARYWPAFQEHQIEFDDLGALVGSQVCLLYTSDAADDASSV